VSKQTVARIRSYLRAFNQAYPPLFNLRGRPRVLTPAQESFIVDYLHDRPSAYLSEVQWVLQDEFEVIVELHTLSRAIRRQGWTRKTLKRHAAERSEHLRTRWLGRMAEWSPEQVVFVDESVSNERTGWRKYGWSPRGVAPIEIASIKRSQRWSILPAYSIEGWIEGTLCIQGSITAEIFNDWLRDTVLPYCRRRRLSGYPPQVLIMDNASIHRSSTVRQLCRRAGVELAYLPPYSPDFNPIEISFFILKAWIRNNIQLAPSFSDFGQFLEYAIEFSNAGQYAKEHFNHCGYIHYFEEHFIDDWEEESPAVSPSGLPTI